MKRRNFVKTSLGTMGANLLVNRTRLQAAPADEQFPNVPGLTRYVAEFVVKTKYGDIPRDVIELGKKSILDGFGLALAGSVAETGPLSRKYLQSLGLCNGTSTVVGTSIKTGPRFAAFTNGIAIHADDFDDTQLSAAKDRVYGLLVHPAVSALAAAFAMGEQRAVSGRDLMLAYHLGVEVECKIAEANAPRHYQDGFHSTGTCGSFGSAAACAKLLGMNVEETLNVFGIAASLAGGLRENFGTMTKPLQAGHAAENGVIAAELAALGWTAAPQILEAPRGFFHAYGGTFEPAAISSRLGSPWTFASPGISLKPFPSGSLTHPAMTEMLRLMEKHALRAAQVEKVDVGTNSNMPNALIHHHPQNGLEAKFSMEFCVAILLLEGKAGLSQFRNEVVRRPDVQEMIKRVNFYVDPEAERAGYDKMTSILTVHLKDGSTISGRADFAKGSPADPMTFKDASAKFRTCAEYAGWPGDRTEKIIELVNSLEQTTDVRKIAALLSGAARRG